MPLDDGFWDDSPQEKKDKAKVKTGNGIEEAPLEPPADWTPIKTIQGHMQTMAQYTRQAFPKAEIRDLPARVNQAQPGFIASIGMDRLHVKSVYDRTRGTRIRAFLMEGIIQVMANRLRPASARVLENQVASGDFGDPTAFIAWLSWAHRQLMKIEAAKLKDALHQDNCLPSIKFYAALRSAWTLSEMGLSAADVVPDVKFALPWKLKGTKGVARMFRVKGMADTEPIGAVAFDLRGDQWILGIKAKVNDWNPAVEETEVRQRIEIEAAKLGDDMLLARAAVSQAADTLYAEVWLNFLWRWSHIRGLREADLG